MNTVQTPVAMDLRAASNGDMDCLSCCRICGQEGVRTVDVFGEEGRRRQILNKIRFCFSKQVRDLFFNL